MKVKPFKNVALSMSKTRKLLSCDNPRPGKAFIILNNYYDWCILMGWELPEGVPP